MRTIIAVGFIVLITTFVEACDDRETRHIQPHWAMAMEDYELTQVSLHRRELDGRSHEVGLIANPNSRERCFEDRGVYVCVRDLGYGFWLDVRNKSDKPTRLLWPEARYVDEEGKSHVIYHHEPPPDYPTRPNQPPTGVQPGGRVKVAVAPGYKTYNVVNDNGDEHVYHEPLVPTRLDDKDEAQMKAHVNDLAKRQMPVRLLLPIEIDGVRYDYTFSFVLRHRWADLPKE